MKTHRGFTLVELMIVVAVVALLAAIALPGFLRARKRSQAAMVLTDLRLIQSAVDQYALEFNRLGGSVVTPTAWKQYVKVGSRLYETMADFTGAPYGEVLVDEHPSIPADTFDYLSDVVTADYWSPFERAL